MRETLGVVLIHVPQRKVALQVQVEVEVEV